MTSDQAESDRQSGATVAERQVSLFHLYALRILFALMALFLVGTIGPRLLEPPPTLMTGAARALFTALGLLAALGVRYPVRMIPLMIFEFSWKALWLAFIGLPLWAAGRLDPDSAQTFFEVGVGVVVVPIILPWRYVWQNYISRPGDRWR